jgi:hypothetical protein
MSLIDTLTNHFKDSTPALSAFIMLSAAGFFGISAFIHANLSFHLGLDRGFDPDSILDTSALRALFS